jgi:hypothetical protein
MCRDLARLLLLGVSTGVVLGGLLAVMLVIVLA